MYIYMAQKVEKKLLGGKALGGLGSLTGEGRDEKGKGRVYREVSSTYRP